jgi:transglutaminase-like putative cysteine protease
MRIRIHHSTRYDYAGTARSIVQMLRVTPRSYDGQQVIHWRLDADADVRLRTSEDAFGNVVHSLSTEQPTRTLTVTVTGEVATHDTSGVVRGGLERLPDAVYLRRTALTEPDRRSSRLQGPPIRAPKLARWRGRTPSQRQCRMR